MFLEKAFDIAMNNIVNVGESTDVIVWEYEFIEKFCRFANIDSSDLESLVSELKLSKDGEEFTEIISNFLEPREISYENFRKSRGEKFEGLIAILNK